MELTAQKGKGDREARTSDGAQTRDLRSIAEFQPREHTCDRYIGAMGDEGSRPVSMARVAETPR